jgi:filamentous hemagglutinin
MKNTSIVNPIQPKSLTQRITAMVMSLVMLGQILVPGVAAAAQIISDDTIAKSMVNPFFQYTNSNGFLYTKAEYADAVNLHHQDIASFHKRLVNAKVGLPAPTYIPIAGEITIFIPHYPVGKLLGDIYVQNRFIRQQVFNTLGRHLIDVSAYADEVSQINALYNNAYLFAQSQTNYKYGDKLPASVTITSDMIWPERRLINGATVVAPILYLRDETIAKQSVNDHEIEFHGSVNTFGSVTIDHATLYTGRNTFIQTLGNFTNTGKIAAGGNLKLNVGGVLGNLSGSINVQGNLDIIAAQVYNKTLVHAFSDRYGQGTRLGQIASVNANGNITIKSTNDIVFEGATAKSQNGGITMDAGNNILIVPVKTQYSSQTRQGDWRVSSSSLDLLGSSIQAKDTIKLIADGAIQITASELISTEGGIELLAQQGIYVLDELTQEQIQKVDRKGKTKGQSSEFRTEAVRAVLSAGKGVLLDSEYGDVTLKASKITSTEGAQVKAQNGTVHLLMTKELEEKHLSTVKKTTWKIKTRTEDIVHENNIQNTIVGGLQVQATYGINVEYTGKPGATLKQQIEEYRNMPGMEWMAQLYDQSLTSAGGNVDWEKLEEIHKEIKKSKSTLSPAAMAIIAICVAVAMGPAGAGFIGSGGSLATVAGSSTLGAALSAGALTLTTQAVQSLAAGNNLRETFNAMDSKDSLKSLAVSMVTAGAMQAAQLDMFKIPEGTPVSATTIAKQVGQAVVNSTVSAGVSTVIYGGNSQEFLNSFKQGLMTSAVNKIGEKMANKIGAAYKGGDINNVVRYISHAGAGCVMGLGLAGASGSENDEKLSCFSGAGGAVAGELAADAYKAQKVESLATEYKGMADQLRNQGATNAQIEAIFQSPEMQDYMSHQMAQMKAVGVDLAKLSGAFAALAAGGDVTIASQTAENAAANNALFLIPLAILALKAIDITLTAKDLWDIYDTNKNNPEALSKELGKWLAEQAGGAIVGKVIPGFKTAEEMLVWMRKNDILSPSMLDGISKSFKGFNNQPPTSNLNVTKAAPTPQNPMDLSTVGGKSSFVKQMNVSNDAIRNDGVLGEKTAEFIIGDATGLTFRTTLKNNSNNGVDLISLDDKNKTIWIVEVKSSINAQFPSAASQNLVTRSDNWIRDAAKGTINGQKLDPAEVQYANDVLALKSQGWNIKPMYSTVSIPKPNTTGPATVTIEPIF